MYQSKEYQIAKRVAKMTGDDEMLQTLDLNTHYINFQSNRAKLPYLVGNNYIYNNPENTIAKAKVDGVTARLTIHKALVDYHSGHYSSSYG